MDQCKNCGTILQGKYCHVCGQKKFELSDLSLKKYFLGVFKDFTHFDFKLFKDIPQPDIETLLPGANIRIGLFEQARIAVPTLTGICLTLLKLLKGAAAVAFGLGSIVRLFDKGSELAARHFMSGEIEWPGDAHPVLGLLVRAGIGIRVGRSHQKLARRNEQHLHADRVVVFRGEETGVRPFATRPLCGGCIERRGQHRREPEDR